MKVPRFRSIFTAASKQERTKNFENYWRISQELYFEFPKHVNFCANYAEAVATRAAMQKFMVEAKHEPGMEGAIELFKALWQKTGQEYYARKLELCEKMQQANTDLRELIVEMASF